MQSRRFGGASLTVVSFLVFVVGLLGASAARGQGSGGSITAINGNVSIQRVGRSFPAAYGTAVQVGDRVTTTANGRVTITLSDNTQLELTESSTLVLTENVLNTNGSRASTKVALTGGLVRSLVRFTAGTPPNFEVHTPNAVASARGTTYDTNYQSGATRQGFKNCSEFSDVSVYDGAVRISNPTNPSAPPVDLKAGEKNTVPCGQAALPATVAAAAGGAATGAAVGVGIGAGTAAGAAAGTAVIAGGVLGGVAASGGFGGGSSSSSAPGRPPLSPAQ